MTTPQTRLRIGTRGSPLALWQARHVAQLLERADPTCPCEIVVISTQGDRDRVSPLPSVGGKGLFTEDIEAQLRDGSIDLAVHSLKDMPTEEATDLAITAIPLRGPHRDVVVSRHRLPIAQLPANPVIGTSSTRRSAQLRVLRPDVVLADIRGNIDTRIRNALAADGPYDAIILAEAGVLRLGLAADICETLSVTDCVPAPAQGALGIQTRTNGPIAARVAAIADIHTTIAVTAERAVLHALALGCSAPIGAYAVHEHASTYTFVARAPGSTPFSMTTCTTTFVADSIADAREAGATMAAALRAAQQRSTGGR